jgi:tRNA uridine 5-carboxymethylaminomethyl modification enzyme
MRDIERQRAQASTRIPAEFDYAAVRGLSNEVREKLTRIRPQSIGQASRIPGMTPAAIALLLIQIKKRDLRKSA